MSTIYALSIPADSNEGYNISEIPLAPARIAAQLGNDYRLIETDVPGVQFYEATTGDINHRAAALCQLDDAAAGKHPKTRRPRGPVLITGDDGNGNSTTIPDEKLHAYSLYLDFTL